VYRTVVSGAGPEDIDTSHVRTYQVYRGMSPTTSNRLEVSHPRVSQDHKTKINVTNSTTSITVQEFVLYVSLLRSLCGLIDMHMV